MGIQKEEFSKWVGGMGKVKGKKTLSKLHRIILMPAQSNHLVREYENSLNQFLEWYLARQRNDSRNSM